MENQKRLKTSEDEDVIKIVKGAYDKSQVFAGNTLAVESFNRVYDLTRLIYKEDKIPDVCVKYWIEVNRYNTKDFVVNNLEVLQSYIGADITEANFQLRWNLWKHSVYSQNLKEMTVSIIQLLKQTAMIPRSEWEKVSSNHQRRFERLLNELGLTQSYYLRFKEEFVKTEEDEPVYQQVQTVVSILSIFTEFLDAESKDEFVVRYYHYVYYWMKEYKGKLFSTVKQFNKEWPKKSNRRVSTQRTASVIKLFELFLI